MGAPGVERLSWLKWIIAIAVTAILVAAATTVVVRKLQPAQSADIMRFSFVLPQDQGFSNPGRHVIAISPDGASIVYVAEVLNFGRSRDPSRPRHDTLGR